MLSGESATIRRENVSVMDSGFYDLTVTNYVDAKGVVEIGRATSRKINVQVLEPVTAMVLPVSQTASPGAPASFRIVVNGSAPLQYRWSRITSDASGKVTEKALKVTGDTLAIAAAKAEDFAMYKVSVTGPLGGEPLTVDGFGLSQVDPGPVILRQPASTVVREGGDLSFSVEMQAPVDPSAGYVYAWYKSGVLPLTVLSDKAALTLQKVTDRDSGFYYVVVSDASGAWVQSVPALAFVNLANPIGLPSDAAKLAELRASQNVFANEGESLTLRTFAVGDGLRYQWRRLDGRGMPASAKGMDQAALVLRNVTREDAGEYVAAVSLPDGTPLVESAPWKVMVVALPVILNQPESQVRLPGETATLSVGAVVNSDTRFQWFFRTSAGAEWVPVPGAAAGSAAGSTCTINPVRDADDGEYRLEVSNSAGTVSSDIARVTVLKPAAVTAVQVDLAVADPGDTVNFTTVVSGSLIVEKPYQWYFQSNGSKLWRPLAGQTSASLVLKDVDEGEDGFYKLRVFGKVNGAADSEPVRVSVRDKVALASGQRMLSTSLVAGEKTSFTVLAKGHDVQYQWCFRKDLTQKWAPVNSPSATSATLVFDPARAEDSGYYGVYIFNRFANGGSSAAGSLEKPLVLGRLTVYSPPLLLSPVPALVGDAVSPGDGQVVVNEGRSFSLSATLRADSTMPVSYAWYKNGVVLPSSAERKTAGQLVLAPVNLILPISSVTEADAGRYELRLTNAYGITATTPVSVVVRLKPRITQQPQTVTVVEGSSAGFRVGASGSDVTYRWVEGVLGEDGRATFPDFGDPNTVPLAVGPLLGFTGVSKTLKPRVFKAAAVNDIAWAESDPVRLIVVGADDLQITRQAALEGLAGGVAWPGVSNVSLAVEARGSGTLVYQWRKNGVPIPGATAASHVLGVVTNASAGVYDVFISNDANFVYSTPVTLVLDPHVDSVLVPEVVNPGDGVRLEAKVSSSKPASLQWYKKAADGSRFALVDREGIVEGARSEVLLLKAVEAADAGEYQLEARTAEAGALSDWMPMVVLEKVSITQHPVGVSANEGGRAVLSVQATGGGALRYRWFKDGTALKNVAGLVSGVESSELVLGALRSPGDSGSYQVEVSNPVGAVLSLPAVVAVAENFAVSVEVPPRVTLGQGASLVAVPRGPGKETVAFQWYRGGGSRLQKLVGETAAQLRINPVSKTDVDAYTVEITSISGAKATGAARLELSIVPELLAPLSSQTVALGAKALFAVGVRYPYPLKYEWFKGAGRTPLAGVQGDQLRIGSATAADFTTYTVRVSDANNPEVFVESTARLAQAVGASPSTVTGAEGATGTLSAANYAPWWVFWVDASEGTGSTPARRQGYWVLERKQVLDPSGNVVAVVSGRSAWVWLGENKPSEWSPEEQQVQDASANSKSEFSIISSKSGAGVQTFVLSGSVESGGEAAFYGAPDLASGVYNVESDLDLELSWDAARVSDVGALADWASVLSALKEALLGTSSGTAGE